MDKWKGKVAIVTGASSGIGASICEKLVKKGLQVVGFARRVGKIENLSKNLENAPGKLIPLFCDVTDPKSIQEAFKWVKTNLGPVHVLVNNAGAFRAGPLLETSFEDWKLCLETNVLGMAKCSQEAFRQMEEAKIDGQIVLINSVAGHYPILNDPPMSNMYSPSKFAVTCLADTLRRELVYYRTKIKISCVSPGFVDTELFQASGLGDLANQLKGKVPHLKPEDVAEATVYILSVPNHVQIHDIIIRPVGDKN